MDNPLENLLYNVTGKFVGYLPNLVAGIILVALGWFLGWLVKRIVVKIFAVFRVDRLLRRFHWGAPLSKADVRFAFFDFIGNIAFLIIFLIFLNASLEALKLTILSHILERGVLLIPKMLISLVIIGLGWIVSGWISNAVQKALAKEEIPRATLIARFAKFSIMLFFSAMSLTALNIAREIVVIGFSVTIITLGVLAIVLTFIGGKTFVNKILESFEE